MNIRYVPNPRFIKRNAKKYFKASGQKFGILRRFKFAISTIGVAKKIDEKSISINDRKVVVRVGNEKEVIIKYRSIQNIIIDEDDIIIVNDIKPLLIPKYAFTSLMDRNEFISDLNYYYETAKLAMQSDIMNASIDLFVEGDGRVEKDADFTSIYSIEKKEYVNLKVYAKRKTYKEKVKRYIAKIFVALGLIGLFVILALNYMGAFSVKEFTSISAGIGIVLGLYYIFVAYLLFFSGKHQIEKGLQVNIVRLKIEIFEGMILIDEGREQFKYKVGEITSYLKTEKGIVFSTKNSDGECETFILPKKSEMDVAKNNEFLSIITNMVTYYDKQFDKYKNRKVETKGLKVIFSLAIVCMVVAYPITILYVSSYMPSYYQKISKENVIRSKEQALAIINSGKSVPKNDMSNQNDSSSDNNQGNENQSDTNNTNNEGNSNNYQGENSGGASKINYSNPIANNDGYTLPETSNAIVNPNLFKASDDYSTINKLAKKEFSDSVNKYLNGDITMPSEYVFTKAQAMAKIKSSGGGQLTIPSSLWVLMSGNMVENNLLSRNMQIAKDQLIGGLEYIPVIQNSSIKTALESSMLQSIVAEYLVSNAPNGFNNLVLLNQEMPIRKTREYVINKVQSQSERQASYEGKQNMNVGAVQVGEANMLYRLVGFNSGDTYKYMKVYENGAVEPIGQFTLPTRQAYLEN